MRPVRAHAMSFKGSEILNRSRSLTPDHDGTWQGNRLTRRARQRPPRGRGVRRSDLSAGPTKTLKAWMERDGARVPGARPGAQFSASSAMLRALRVDLLRVQGGSRGQTPSFNDSDPLILPRCLALRSTRADAGSRGRARATRAPRRRSSPRNRRTRDRPPGMARGSRRR